jgi:hypothetical protein
MSIERLKRYRFKEVMWRVGSKSKDGTKANMLVYVDARDCMDAMDELFGAGNWMKSYDVKGEYILCKIWLRDSNGTMVVAMEDGADKTDVEQIKGGLSDAFKRCCVALGLGRYLYDAKNVNTWIPSDKVYDKEALFELTRKFNHYINSLN